MGVRFFNNKLSLTWPWPLATTTRKKTFTATTAKFSHPRGGRRNSYQFRLILVTAENIIKWKICFHSCHHPPASRWVIHLNFRAVIVQWLPDSLCCLFVQSHTARNCEQLAQKSALSVPWRRKKPRYWHTLQPSTTITARGFILPCVLQKRRAAARLSKPESEECCGGEVQRPFFDYL